METVIHTYLTKLRIISKIPENGRLDTTNNDLNIYYNSITSWCWRKFQGDNKEQATKYLMDLYKEINAFSDQLMYNINTERDNIKKCRKIVFLVSLTEKIKESLMGVRNLIGTYKEYLKTVSLLECLEQDIIVPQFRVLKHFIPEQYHTEIIKSAITYSYVHTGGMISSRNRSLSESNAPEMDMGVGRPDNLSSTPTYNSPASLPESLPTHSAPPDLSTQFSETESKNNYSIPVPNGNLGAFETHAVSQPIPIPKNKHSKSNKSR